MAFAILVGLGIWQLERLKWKETLLARIAALRNAPAVPLAQAIRVPAAAEYRRVAVACQPPVQPAPVMFRYALRSGEVAWRALAFCRLSLPPFDGILLDRGVVPALGGLMAPRPVRLPDPAAAVGILRAPGARPWLDTARPQVEQGMIVARVIDPGTIRALAAASGVSRPLPYLVAVEGERPPPPGVAPAALPQDIPNNHLGYALTWFGLAAGLAWVAGGRIRRGPQSA